MQWNLLKNKELQLVSAALLLGTLFVLSRTILLSKTLEFFADMGRDLLVVQTAVSTLKPPLLGPSTSALPINQSAWYFYLLLPIFLLTGGSPYTSVITGIILYCSVGIAAWILTKNCKWLRQNLLVIFFLVLLHPQFIIQTRSPWNPSFAMAFLFLALISVLEIRRQPGVMTTAIFGFALSAAVACTYSVIPIAALLLLFVMSSSKTTKQKLHTLVWFLLGLLVWFLPSIGFELRHDFLQIRSLVNAIGSTQQTFGIKHELIWMSRYLFGILDTNYLTAAVVCVTSCLAMNLKQTWHSKSLSAVNFRLFLSLLVLAIGLTIFAPFGIENHYVLGLSLVLFFTISFMQTKVLLICLATLSLIWLHPNQLQLLTQPARRSIKNLEACVKQICNTNPQSMYLTVQAWHNYHYAPEYLFLFSKYGCTVADPSQTELGYTAMGVIADQSTYTHGQDAFHELTLFGNAQVDRVIECPSNITLTILKK